MDFGLCQCPHIQASSGWIVRVSSSFKRLFDALSAFWWKIGEIFGVFWFSDIFWWFKVQVWKTTIFLPVFQMLQSHSSTVWNLWFRPWNVRQCWLGFTKMRTIRYEINFGNFIQKLLFCYSLKFKMLTDGIYISGRFSFMYQIMIISFHRLEKYTKF